MNQIQKMTDALNQYSHDYEHFECRFQEGAKAEEQRQEVELEKVRLKGVDIMNKFKEKA